ncbi:MAG: hypothetical protein KDK70_07550 [Myxococcales bacterium]|nr:hypothetical protein [Myxococcales bacterium]
MRRTLAGLGLATALLSCGDGEPAFRCTDLECDGGFDLWLTSTNTNNVYDPGRYDIVIEFGERGVDGELTIECTIDASGGGSCDAAEWVTPSAEGVVVTATFGEPPAQQVIDTPAIQLHFEGRSEAPAGENVFGPATVTVDIERDTHQAGNHTYTPVYERNEEFNGHVDCGFCDSREREILRLDP